MHLSKFIALSLIGFTSILSAEYRGKQNCAPEPPAACNEDACCRTYCLGPDNFAGSPPVNPITCNGDWVITVAGFYWNAHQDGMEYAVDSKVRNSQTERVEIIDAKYLNPNFGWDWGFKAGIGYNTTCDGWDFGVLWTRYHGKASSHDEAEEDDNHTLLPIWTDDDFDLPIFATDIETQWSLNLDLVDIELGRDFWNSKRLAIRPHVGLRIARIRQKFNIEHKGGSWSSETPAVNNEVDIDNDFKGVGIRGGLDTVWNFGCGWALYGNIAISIVYGRFHVDHDEMDRAAVAPFSKEKIFETKDSFRCSSEVKDLALGIQWSSLFCDCKYGFTAKLGWEQHIFMDQNQMWRVTRVAEEIETSDFLNSFSQRRGNLSTQGWTLTLVFDF